MRNRILIIGAGTETKAMALKMLSNLDNIHFVEKMPESEAELDKLILPPPIPYLPMIELPEYPHFEQPKNYITGKQLPRKKKCK